MTDLRREDDKRISDLDKKVTEIAADVKAIERMLITEPEASPLGRSLLTRSRENQQAITDLRRDFNEFRRSEFDPIDDWWQQTRGAWRLVLGVGVVLGIVGTIFGVAAYFGLGS